MSQGLESWAPPHLPLIPEYQYHRLAFCKSCHGHTPLVSHLPFKQGLQTLPSFPLTQGPKENLLLFKSTFSLMSVLVLDKRSQELQVHSSTWSYTEICFEMEGCIMELRIVHLQYATFKHAFKQENGITVMLTEGSLRPACHTNISESYSGPHPLSVSGNGDKSRPDFFNTAPGTS